MSDVKISQYNRALQAIEHYPTVFEDKKRDMGVQVCLTKLQNHMEDMRVQNHEYNQQRHYFHKKNLLKSYENQSRFYTDSTFWTILGRIGQGVFIVSSGIMEGSGKVWEHFIKKFPISEDVFKAGHQIYSSFHERINPALKSDQIIEQKKVEHLTQSDNTESNIIDRVQQMFQNAKDLLSQLYKSFSS